MEILNSDIPSQTTSYFLSAPTSPDIHLLNALLFSDDTETSGDFEFHISQRYCFQEEPLPLELPPGLRGRTGNPSGSSPGSIFKTWQNFWWRTDFDPFVAALEKVRRVEKGGRRARSLSPFRGDYGGSEEDLHGLLLNQVEKKSVDHLGSLEEKVATKLAQPRGLEFARRVRLVELKKNGNIEKDTHNSKGKSKGQIFMKKLLISRSKTTEAEQNTESSAMVARKRSFLRRLGFKSSRSAELVEEKKKKTSEMVKSKMDFMRSNGNLLCLGYGIKTES